MDRADPEQSLQQNEKRKKEKENGPSILRISWSWSIYIIDRRTPRLFLFLFRHGWGQESDFSNFVDLSLFFPFDVWTTSLCCVVTMLSGGASVEGFILMSLGLAFIGVRIMVRWMAVGPANFQLDDYLMPLAGVRACIWAS